MKDDDRTSHIPVVLLSAYNNRSMIEAGFAAGATDYLSKPFQLDVIIKYVQDMLNSNQKARA